MKSGYLKNCVTTICMVVLFVTLVIVLPTSSLSANDNLYELQPDEYDNASLCDMILNNLDKAKINVIDNSSITPVKISHRTLPPFEEIFRHINNHNHLSVDYIVVKEIIIKLIHMNKKFDGKQPPRIKRSRLFHILGIDPNIKSEELSAWCDKLHIIMKLDQKRLLEVDIFTELNE